MAYVLADRVKETTTSTGTGNLTLAGAVAGFRAFSSVMSSGDCFTYAVVNSTGTEWEVGLGTLSGSNVLVRGTLFSSSTGSAVNFSAGAKDVFITQSGANQFNVFDENQIAVETPADVANGYMRREYYVNNLSSNPGAYSGVSQGAFYSAANTTLQAYYQNPSTFYNRTAYSGISVSSVAINQSYLTTNPGDWNWTGGSNPLFLSYMSFDGTATNGVTSDAISTNHQFWQAYSGTPTFDYWDAPSTTYFPVTTGDIMVGDGSTVPKWYRRTTTGWEPFGLAKLNVGAGLYITNNGVGEATLYLGGPPPPGYYSYINENSPVGPTMSPPTDWDVTLTSTPMWSWGTQQPSGYFQPSPPWAWSYITNTYPLGNVYSGYPPNVTDPSSVGSTGYPINGQMFVINPSIYGNSSYYPLTTNQYTYSTYSSSPSFGGWPLMGTSKHGFGCMILPGDFTGPGMLVAGNSTIDESIYFGYGNYTVVFFRGNDADVIAWAAYGTILSLPYPANCYIQLWYTYS